MLIAERSKGQVKVYAADFSGADNLLKDAVRNANPAALTPELAYIDAATPASPAGATKELFMDSQFVEGTLQCYCCFLPLCGPFRFVKHQGSELGRILLALLMFQTLCF